MSIFAIRKIDGLHGHIDFYKLFQGEKCEFDEFWARCQKDGNLSKELNTIQTRLQELSEGKIMPQAKFKDITPKNEKIREFELKTKHLRLYMFHDTDQGRIIVMGGKKTTQRTDIPRFRGIKTRYFQNKD